jgi:sulfonate transport system substrate-binding protein
MPSRTHPSHRRRRAGLATVLLAVLFASVATGSAQAKHDGPVGHAAINLHGITLNVGGQTDGLKSLLTASGTLKGKQYAIKWATFTSGPPILEALQAGRIDLGGIGNTPPIFAAATRANFRLVAAIPQRNNNGDDVIVKGGSSIKKLADLKGKRIAYTRGSSGHGFIIQALKRAHLTTKQVTLVDLTPGDSLAAFTSGRVDAWATWEPFISIAAGTAAKARVVPDGGGYAASGLGFVAASNKILSNVRTRTAVRDYLVRLQRGLKWGVAHRSAWATAFHDESGLPVATALQAINKTLVDLKPVRGKLITTEQKLANALAAAKAVKKVNIRSIVSNQLAK